MHASKAAAVLIALESALCTTAHAGPGAGAGAELAVDGLTFVRLAHAEGGWYRRQIDVHLDFDLGRVDGDDEGASGWVTEAMAGMRGYVACVHHLCVGAGLKIGWAHLHWTAGIASGVQNRFVLEPALELSVRPAQRWRINLAVGPRASGPGNDKLNGGFLEVTVVFDSSSEATDLTSAQPCDACTGPRHSPSC